MSAILSLKNWRNFFYGIPRNCCLPRLASCFQLLSQSVGAWSATLVWTGRQARQAAAWLLEGDLIIIKRQKQNDIKTVNVDGIVKKNNANSTTLLFFYPSFYPRTHLMGEESKINSYSRPQERLNFVSSIGMSQRPFFSLETLLLTYLCGSFFCFSRKKNLLVSSIPVIEWSLKMARLNFWTILPNGTYTFRPPLVRELEQQ